MTKIVAIGIARMGSTRLPGKVLMPLPTGAGHDKRLHPVIDWVRAACESADGVDEFWVATSTDRRDDLIEEWCIENGVGCHRGSEHDVLQRFYETAVKAEADLCIRVTCDCPFLDPGVIKQLIALQRMTVADYVSNVDPPTFPDGLDCEIFKMAPLREAIEFATRPTDRDTVTQWIQRNKFLWHQETLICPLPGLQKERWVLDTADDLAFCKEVASKLYYQAPAYTDILNILEKDPEIRKLNPGARNERFLESVALEMYPEVPQGASKFQLSNEMLKRAQKVMPYGAGTYSKSHVAYGTGLGPLYVVSGDGGRVFDVDGNDYVDLSMSLAANILGYRDPDVDAAVRRQQCRGISYSLGTEIEIQLAEVLKRVIPCAEMSMFCKNGSDATAAAVRLARGVTGRDIILMMKDAYHGWHDWSIGNTVRSYGVLPYGDVWHVDPNDDGWISAPAAVIIEGEQPVEVWERVGDFCKMTGALMIVDEMLTGFRCPSLSAQKHHRITPDLACFGKGMANGYPIAAVCGKADIMKRMAPGKEPNIFFSGTMFGETGSIAAALATIEKIRAEDVPSKIWTNAAMLSIFMANNVIKYGLGKRIGLGGPPLYRFNWNDPKDAVAFRHHMAMAGVLIYGSFNTCAAHTVDDIKRAELALNYAFERIAGGDNDYPIPGNRIMRR